MKILFVTNSLNYRGTTTAILDYAKYNEELLGNESIIAYNDSLGDETDMGNVLSVIDTIPHRVVSYGKTKTLNQIIDVIKPDLVYRIGAGEPLEPIVCDSVYHAVFQFKNHQITAYVSEWLSKECTDSQTPFVPHIVDLPEATKNYKTLLNIPEDAFVVGRHGGYYTFDIPFVKEYVKKSLEKDKNLYYVFLNTEPFYNHDRIKYLNPIHDKQRLSNFISTCDVMLHARTRGESFGLSICEFLYHNKPVVAFAGGYDKNHLNLVHGNNLYTNEYDLDVIFDRLKERKDIVNYREIVSKFSPDAVMEKFKTVFLEK